MGIRNTLKKTLVGLLVFGTLALASCKSKDNDGIVLPPAGSNNPVILTAGLPNATENTPYSAQINAYDPESDPITYSITGGTADVFLAINPNTGEIYNDSTITDVESGVTHTLNVRAQDDNGHSDEKTYAFYVNNTENVSGNVRNMFTGSNFSGATVTVGGKSDTTDSSGNFYIENLNDGNHTMTVTHANTHPSQWSVETKKSENTTNLTYKVVPKSFDMDLFDRCFRSFNGNTFVGAGNGATQRPTDEDCANWQCYIDTNPAYGSGQEVTPTMISYAQNFIENQWPNLTNGKLTPKESNGRLHKTTNPPAYGTPRTTYLYWNGTSNSGHAEILNGNTITANGVAMNPSDPQRVYEHELYQVLGARHDDTIPESKKPNTILGSANTITTWDENAMKYNFNVPIGTKSPDKRLGKIND